MTMKIKEFKGSLNPIFNEGRNDLDSEVDVFSKEQTAKDYLPINKIKPKKNQPRKIFDELALEELAQSIKSKGVIQPIIVRSIEKGSYEIIVGERRWRAAKKAGLDEIPAIVREYNESDGMAVALIENIQRENLNPLEEAEAIQSLLDECSMTHSHVAESIGRSRATVGNLLRLLALTDEVKSMINAGLLEMGHARALLSLSGEKQIEIANLVISKKLSVRETERIVQNINTPKQKNEFYVDPELKRKASDWTAQLSKKLLSKINLHFSSDGKAKMTIHFDSLEEVEWAIKHMEISGD